MARCCTSSGCATPGRGQRLPSASRCLCAGDRLAADAGRVLHQSRTPSVRRPAANRRRCGGRDAPGARSSSRSLFKPDFGVFTTILKGLIVIAFLPALISLLFSLRTGLRKPRRHDALFRLWRQHGARRDARRCGAARRRSGPRVLRGWRYVIAQGYGSVAPAAGHVRIRRAVAAHAARSRGAECVRESRQRALSPHHADRRDRRAAGERARLCRPHGRQAPRRCPAIRSASSRPPRIGACRRAILRSLRRLAPGYRAAPPGRDRRDRMNVRHVVIRGRVQGVGFRAFVEDAAERAEPRRLGAQPARRHGRGGLCRTRAGGRGRDRGVPHRAARRAGRCGGCEGGRAGLVAAAPDKRALRRAADTRDALDPHSDGSR